MARSCPYIDALTTVDRIKVDPIKMEGAAMGERISTAEAAARLGVKRETLYAYVSRGLLASAVGADGRGRPFDPGEVDGQRRRRNHPRAGRLDAQILSTITQVADQRIFVRGHDLVELVTAGTSFEAVATLLWTGELAPAVEWPRDGALARRTARAQAALPDDAPLIDRLRLSVAVASACDDLRTDRRAESVVRLAPALIAAMVDGFSVDGRSVDGRSVDRGGPRPGHRIAERLWVALATMRPTLRGVAALDAALALAADHDLAASTFAARVAASTRADPYAVVGAGLGAFDGPLHGAASRPVHRLLEEARRGRVTAAVGAALADDRRQPGFGHFLYPAGDPRGRTLLELVRAAPVAPARLALCEEVLELVRDRTGLDANVDFALAALTFCTGMRDDAGEAIFAIGRTAGWIAHALEEYGEAPLRFRPIARYVGRPAPKAAGNLAP
jgi:citrate synthase